MSHNNLGRFSSYLFEFESHLDGAKFESEEMGTGDAATKTVVGCCCLPKYCSFVIS